MFPKIALPLLLSASSLPAATLYSTDFEEFTAGLSRWAGTGGWLSNDTASGAQAIDQDLIAGGGLGKTSSLGFRRPLNLFTTVAKAFNHNASATGLSRIQISTLLGIEDSTNGRGDDFYLSIYNAAGNRLASIRFDNQPPSDPASQFGIWREDGVSQFDTRQDFFHGELYELFITIDVSANTWSASIGGIPMFEDAPFTATAHARDFGIIAFEWRVSGPTTLAWGDNYLLVADLSVRSVPNGDSPFTSAVSRSTGGEHVVSWQADAGNDYQVQYSHDLVEWFDDLPASSFPGFTTTEQKTYADTTAPLPGKRFYRVRRTESN